MVSCGAICIRVYARDDAASFRAPRCARDQGSVGEFCRVADRTCCRTRDVPPKCAETIYRPWLRTASHEKDSRFATALESETGGSKFPTLLMDWGVVQLLGRQQPSLTNFSYRKNHAIQSPYNRATCAANSVTAPIAQLHHGDRSDREFFPDNRQRRSPSYFGGGKHKLAQRVNSSTPTPGSHKADGNVFRCHISIAARVAPVVALL